MELDWTILRSEEQTMYRLRGLYERYGYRRFKMSKFEEYDLYIRNKDFLVSDRMITFTDARGVLMALKPDITLSIIKNNSGDSEKVYYNEGCEFHEPKPGAAADLGSFNADVWPVVGLRTDRVTIVTSASTSSAMESTDSLPALQEAQIEALSVTAR